MVNKSLTLAAAVGLAAGFALGVTTLAIVVAQPFGPEQKLLDVIARYQDCNQRITAEQICFMVPVQINRRDLYGR